MKRIKKMLSVMLAMAMVLAMNATVFATAVNTDTTPNEKDHTITINNDKKGHTYEAYQVLRGDLDATNKKLSNITWGSGVNGDALLAALKADKTVGADFADCDTPTKVADVLAKFTNDSDKLDAFAEVVGKNLATVAGRSTAEEAPYTIPVKGDGYYLVQDQAGSLTGTESDAYTKYILQVVADVSADAKADAPELDKKIVSGNGDLVSSNNGFVGDKVTYQLISRVPDMDGYETYYYVVHDNLSAGLTFNDDVEVTIGGTKLDKSAYDVLTKKVDADSKENGIKHDNCNLEIVLKDFVQYKVQKDAEIIITYSATINQDAVIGNTGNPNTAHLQYSNDPNKEYNGDPGNGDKPAPGEVTGETPDKQVITYVAGIKLTKIDGADKNKKLDGAKFQISGVSEKVILVNKEIFRESTEGTWYRLKDGTYTEITPETEEEGYTADKYESTETKYEKVTVVDKNTVKENIVTEGWVKDGILTFTGLGAGTFEITELIAPDGYNKLADPITVVITWNDPKDNPKSIWTATQDGKPMTLVGMDSEDDVNKVFDMQVENKSGSLLPSTGGIGTTIFYIVGGILVVGAAILLVTKKRMSKEA